MSRTKTLTARCRSPKGAGALGSAFIGEAYSDFNRHRDHAHALPTSAPMTYALPHTEPEPMDPCRVTPETGEIQTLRRSNQMLAEFRNQVRVLRGYAAATTVDDRGHFIRLNTNPHRGPGEDSYKTAWEVDAIAGAERHRVWLEGEKVKNAALR